MADLESDVIGQVARLPLRPSEANALLPLHEAISNSLHAIHDQFGDTQHAELGKIDINILRGDEQDGDAPVVGFVITDNGIGLNEDNYNSFRTPFSLHKQKKGGKGVGRLGWLKIFNKINVKSQYINGSGLEAIEFDFILREKNQIDMKETTVSIARGHGTRVQMTGFHSAYGSRCPNKTDVIVQRIIGHFLPIFAGNKSPQILLRDREVVDIRKVFRSKIKISEEALLDVDINGEQQIITVRHMKCDKSIRPRGSINNWLCFCANDRGVKEYGIDEQIGLKSLDGKDIYIGTVIGNYLDSHVNPQRTDFIFDTEESKAIRRQAANSIRDFLKDYIDAALTQKKKITLEIIHKYPQYLYLKSEIDEFVIGLKANSNNEEQIYLEMSQHRYRRQRRFNGVKVDIEKAPAYDTAIAEKIEEYKDYIIEDNKGTLAEYVARRKAVLDLLDTLRGFNGHEHNKYHLESAIHQLICPMRIDSNQVSIDDHNLWILDDRLAFYNFFASDLPIKSFVNADTSREPDIAFFYDSCIAWRENERFCDTVILVEFKRPGLEVYTDKNDPFMQLMDYVSLFKTGKTVRDRDGKIISGIGHNTAFHCYIIADLTEGLKKRLRGHFESTPDRKGLFGYTRNPDTYTEVIPYDKLLFDAQARNAIFFSKLGLTD